MSPWGRLRAWFSRTGSEVLGWVLVVVGIILMPLPGPGMLIVAGGFAFLAKHYSWARRVRDRTKAKAMEAAEYGVQTVPRIVLSVLGGVWLFGLGVVWWIGPRIPEFDVLGVGFGPELPAQGWITGLSLMLSACIAWGLIVYSIRRWRLGAATDEPASVA